MGENVVSKYRECLFHAEEGLVEGAEYASLDRFADPMRFPKKLLDKARLPGNYQRISLHAFMARVYSMFSGEDTLILGANHTRQDLAFNFVIQDRDMKK